jgi:hypothetical protein
MVRVRAQLYWHPSSKDAHSAGVLQMMKQSKLIIVEPGHSTPDDVVPMHKFLRKERRRRDACYLLDIRGRDSLTQCAWMMKAFYRLKKTRPHSSCVVMHDMDTLNLPWEAELLEAMREEQIGWISHRSLVEAIISQIVGVKAREFLNSENQRGYPFEQEEEAE